MSSTLQVSSFCLAWKVFRLWETSVTCSTSVWSWNRSLQQEGEVSLHRDFQVFPSSDIDITVLYLNRERHRHCAV